MRGSLFSTLLLCLVVATPAVADQALAKSRNCLSCHAIDKKIVGPAYLDVARKYAGQKDGPDKLTAKILKGGAGVWGVIPMPVNSQVSEAEARKLANWVLSLK